MRCFRILRTAALLALVTLPFTTSELAAGTLTGSGNHLPIPSPNPGGPPGIARTLNTVSGGFTGTWTSPVKPDWVGTYTATGPVPNSSNSGTTHYDFTTLPNGVLPAGTFFTFGDVDFGSVQSETFDFRAWDSGGNLIASPWLDEPIGVWGTGTGSGGTILAVDMPGWDWNVTNPNAYRVDGSTEAGIGNPNVAFALVNNQAIAEMELIKGAAFSGFHLRAPEIPEPGSIVLAAVACLVGAGLRVCRAFGWCGVRR